MNVWIPAICAAIVVVSTAWFLTDRAFTHPRDRPTGAVIGALVGAFMAGGVVGGINLAQWLIGAAL